MPDAKLPTIRDINSENRAGLAWALAALGLVVVVGGGVAAGFVGVADGTPPGGIGGTPNVPSKPGAV